MTGFGVNNVAGHREQVAYFDHFGFDRGVYGDGVLVAAGNFPGELGAGVFFADRRRELVIVVG
ncbi:hypothetical protein ACT16_06695 [Mycobacterium heckeshornense]|nr:hypothetical protein ACT16_06695 [Mycobacterium heckeshornense]